MDGKMNALVYKGKENVSLEKVNLPVLNEGEVLVKVVYAGICGSDVTIYSGKNPNVPVDTIIGHEISGEIVEIKGNVKDLRIGDRVVVEPIISCGKCFFCRMGDYNVCESYRLLGVHTNGGFAEYVKISSERVHKLPEKVSIKAAALIEPLAVAVHAVKQSRLKYGDNAVVIGGGSIGLFVAYVAREAGANVIISDINDYRLDLAKKAGFNVIDVKVRNLNKEVKDQFNNIGADIVFECAGVQSAVNESISVCRAKGQIVVVAAHKDQVPTDFRSVHLKELNLLGIRVYNFTDYQAAISLIASDKIDPELFISHVFPLSNFVKGIDLMRSGQNAMKILLSPKADKIEAD